ncbi:hypothetical protein [Actinokineospora sp. UTMC 2448]|uniref:hypothetical protein n=1 Tax=Actinokineospora sp. UTMC 2448 TaxID=2268449 RepID=UPI0021645088|nr:hypothetical protein [Actinokineospora sp. UTMC 2448]
MARVVVIAAVLFLLAAPAAAQEVEIAIVGGDEPVLVSTEPVAVEVVNNSLRDVAVTVEAGAMSDKQTAVKIDVGAPTAIPAAGSIRVSLTARDTLADGATGWLVVRTDTAIARRAITVGGEETAVTAWSTDWTRWTGLEGDTLPGRIPATCADETATATLVSGDNTARLTATCVDGAYSLAMSDIEAAGPSLGSGEYTGTLDLGESAVEVTVKRSAPVLLAVALLLGGTLVALGAQTWIADRRPISQRRREVERIIPPEEGIANTVVGSAKVDIDTRLRNIRPGGKVRRYLLFWLPWPDGFATARLAAVDTEIARLTSIVERHQAYRDGLATLAANRDVLDRRAPGMRARLDRLAAPPADLDPAELAEHITDAEHADALVRVAEELDSLWAAIDNAAPGTAQWHVEAAHLQFRVLRAGLARLTRPAEVTGLRDQLATAVTLADRLRPDAEGVRPEVGIATDAPALGVGSGVVDRVRRFVVALAGKADRLALRDAAVAVVVGLVALWGGLSALYVGTVWGSVWDLVTAAVWGFGAVTVAAPLVTALKRVGSTTRE